MALNNYLKDVQTLLREANQDLLNPGDLISYINRARREVAMRSQAIRILTPISGSVISATVTDGGSGYSNNPTVTVSAPDFPSGQQPYPEGSQATALAIVQDGVIVSIDITYGGYGYYQPTITIEDDTGTGATATANISYVNQLTTAQEVYPFSQVNLEAFPGVESVYWVRRCSIIFSNWRYSTRVYSFTTYNAMIRTFPFQYRYAPFFCAQYGRGTKGSFYMYPQPSEAYQLEWDCQCLPSDLVDDGSPEAIPEPFTEAVAFYAAHWCYLQLQNFNAAEYYRKLFDEYISRYQKYTDPGGQIDAYGGRW